MHLQFNSSNLFHDNKENVFFYISTCAVADLFISLCGKGFSAERLNVVVLEIFKIKEMLKEMKVSE